MGLPVCIDFTTMVKSFNNHPHNCVSHDNLDSTPAIACTDALVFMVKLFPDSQGKRRKTKPYHVGRMATC